MRKITETLGRVVDVGEALVTLITLPPDSTL
jgi:hypothetical protein